MQNAARAVSLYQIHLLLSPEYPPGGAGTYMLPHLDLSAKLTLMCSLSYLAVINYHKYHFIINIVFIGTSSEQ